MYSTTNGQIPSVGKVEIAWVKTPLTPVSAPAPNNSVPAAKTVKGDDVTHMEFVECDAIRTASPAPAAARGDGSTGNGTGGARAEGSGHEVQDSIDYDVADDNDWGPQ